MDVQLTDHRNVTVVMYVLLVWLLSPGWVYYHISNAMQYSNTIQERAS